MHISQFHSNPSLVAAQFLSPPYLARVEKILDREAIQDREFQRMLADAKRQAAADLAMYEADLARRAAEMAAIDEDIPW